MAIEAHHIPFTEEDERRIASAATWGVIVAVSSLATSAITLVVEARVYGSIPSDMAHVAVPMLGASAVQALLTLLFNAWLLQASLAFRKVAVTDEADQAHLLVGFRKLRAYFMMQVILILLAIGGGILAAIVLPGLL